MTLLDTGIYMITNVKFLNLAVLLDDNEDSDIVGRIEENHPGENWDVTLLNNKRYTIKNHGFTNFARCPFRAMHGDAVCGRAERHQWVIQETRVRGQYTISSTDSKLFWGLQIAEESTPVTLETPGTDKKNQWMFTRTMIPLDTGRYTIMNIKFLNLAVLLDAQENSVIRGRIEEDQAGENWDIKLLKNGRYTIRNHSFNNFATFDSHAEKPGHILGQARRRLWVIQETQIRGQYTISLTDSQKCWGLADGEEDSPVILATTVNDATKWMFTRITLPLDTGRYTIMNVKFLNFAVLLDPNDDSDMVGRTRDNGGQNWDITLLNNKKYTIQNSYFETFVNCDFCAEGDTIQGQRGRSQHWIIEETWVSGQYIISPTNSKLVWGLPDGEEDTPVSLATTVENKENRWIFIRNKIPLDTGTYTIVNAEFLTLAVLPDAEEKSIVVSRAEDNSGGENWNITRLNNKRYMIKNHGVTSFAAYDVRAAPGQSVYGRAGRQQWNIQETTVRGQYTIASTDSKMFWGLANGDEEDEVILVDSPDSAQNQWIFTPKVEMPQNKNIPRDQMQN